MQLISDDKTLRLNTIQDKRDFNSLSVSKQSKR